MLSSGNFFERHQGVTMAVLWSILILIAVILTEWILTPTGRRHAGNAEVSSPEPRRYMVMREWPRSSDYRMAAPKARYNDDRSEVQPFYTLSTDAHGFIEPSLQHDNPDLSIAFLGGSTTECLYVKPENRFPHQTAKKLQQALGLKINGINAARSGNNTMHSLQLLIAKILPLKPDFIVLMHATNDIGVLGGHNTYWNDNKNFRLVKETGGSVDEGWRIIVDRLLPYTSRALLLARKRLVGLLSSRVSAAAGEKGGAKIEWKRFGTEFESALRSFVTITKAWNIKPVLMTQVLIEEKPGEKIDDDYIAARKLARAGLDVSKFSSLHNYFNAIIRHVAQTEGVILVDLAVARKWRHRIHSYDAIHFTDTGSKAVAEIISRELAPHIVARQQ